MSMKFLTEEEIVQTLKRTSLTTVIVEGEDDVTIYRWIENEIGIDKVNFLPCGGRGTLLNVFKRRAEFKNSRVIFVADKDCYVYSEIPDEYTDIIWTTGYSIENDLYFGRHLEKLLDKSEKNKFSISIENFLLYYGFQYEKLKANYDFDFSYHPNQVLNEQERLCNNFASNISYKEPRFETVELLKSNYELLIRGKSLFAIIIRHLSHKRRKVKHSKFTLLEHCFKLHRNSIIDKLILEITKRANAA
jgi:Protein of unknown function (DUF4435)